MSKNSILIIGINGYIGRNLAVYYKQKNYTVIGADIQDDCQLYCDSYYQVNVQNMDSIKNIPFDVDYIFYFAGLTGSLISNIKYQDFIQVNEIGFLNFMSAYLEMKEHPQLVFPSTRLVYAGKKDCLLKEIDETNPLTVYGQNKLSAEKYLEMYRSIHSVPYTVFRIPLPYGSLVEGNASYGTVSGFIERAKSGKVSVYGDGNQKRTVVHIADLINLMDHTIQNSLSIGNIYNIGSSENLSIQEIAQIICSEFDAEIDFIPWPEAEKAIETGDTMFDISRIMDINPDFIFNNTFQEWLKKTVGL